MEKNMDQWNEIADLIDKEKKRALEDFHNQGFVPGDLSSRMAPLSSRRTVTRQVSMAVAASLLLAVGLGLFFWQHGSWRTAPAEPGAAGLLADSFLYAGGNEPVDETPQLRAVSSVFSAWGAATGSIQHDVPETKPVHPSVPFEYGDPASVQRNIKKVIRENRLEQLFAIFREIHDMEV